MAAKGRAGEDGREWLAKKPQSDSGEKNSSDSKTKEKFGYSLEGI
jgi:hypothetical protein